MHRTIPICLGFILALLAVQPAAAKAPAPSEIERMTVQLERLFGSIVGAVDARDIRLKRHGGGLFSLSYPLPARKPLAGPSARRDDDEKTVRTLACGHMLSEPTTPARMTTAVVANIEVPYNLWWAVVNETDEDVERRTGVRVLGPEEFEIDVVDEVVYGANAVHLFWFNPETPFTTAGIHSHRTVVRGAGKVLYRFWVEPVSTTVADR